jgi:O-antigen/teichoic acid export membrane protein
LGVPLISRWGSLGACISVFIAIAAQTVTFLWTSKALVGTALRYWAIVVGVGLAFAPLAYLRASLARNVVLYALAVVGYLVVLRVLGMISARELRVLYQALGLAKAEQQKVTEGS